MRCRLPLFLLACVFFHACARAESHEPVRLAQSEVERLIRNLDSDTFDIREEATRALAEHAEQIWDQLEALASSTDAEVKSRARTAMAAPARRTLKILLEKATTEVETHTKAMKETEQAYRKYDAEAAVWEANTIEAEEKATTQEAKEKQQKALDFLIDHLRTRQTAHQNFVIKYRDIRNRLDTRCDQLRQVIASGAYFHPSMLKDWDPKLLPFDERLNLKVTFELVDMPFDKTCAFLGEMAGVSIEVPAAMPIPEMNLRVTDMSVWRALDWVCKLADLEYSVDLKTQKPVVHKPAPDALPESER